MESHILIGFSVFCILLIIFIISWIFISSKGSWIIKLILSTIIFSSVLLSFYIFKEIQGSPRFISNVENLLVKSYLIREPKGNDPGKIWLWIIQTEKNSEPLNVEIVYSKTMHKLLTESEGLRNGRPHKIIKKANSTTNSTSEQEQLILLDITKTLPQKDVD